ncbi:hypothetical protein PG997_010159 [Apiospora hydei]|uniref:Secreted protein n=1 Tax=Apiospora hydei TaxID=1337664 RepID=A0ABR1VW75_9PEZI
MKLALFTVVLGSTSVLAGCNCKCQDPSGTGPQWNDLTAQGCGTKLAGESIACSWNKQYHGDQHHQCSSSLCCIDSGNFDLFCKLGGAPGAYCWS